MTQRQLHELEDGDLIQSKMTKLFYLVTGNDGDHSTAVTTADVTHADQWVLVAKARYSKSIHREVIS